MNTNEILNTIARLRQFRAQMKPSLDFGPKNLKRAAHVEMAAVDSAIFAMERLEASLDNYSREFTKSLELLND